MVSVSTFNGLCIHILWCISVAHGQNDPWVDKATHITQQVKCQRSSRTTDQSKSQKVNLHNQFCLFLLIYSQKICDNVLKSGKMGFSYNKLLTSNNFSKIKMVLSVVYFTQRKSDKFAALPPPIWNETFNPDSTFFCLWYKGHRQSANSGTRYRYWGSAS